MSILTGQQGSAGGQADGGSGGAGGAGNQPDWRSSLPDDLKQEKVFESIKGKDWNEAGPLLAKSYLHAQRLVGADKIVLPTDKSTPEEIAAFRSKIGVPAKPEEYTFKLPEGLKPEGLNKDRISAWQKEMHEAGLPKAAADRLLSRYLAEEHTAVTSAAAARTKELETNELTLKQEFGVKFDEKVNNARFAMRTFGNDTLAQLLDSTGMGSNPEVVKFFAAIGEKLGDDSARGAGGSGGNVHASPELAQAALNSFNTNADNMKALFDKDHPMHDAKVAERRKLYEAAYPKTD